MSSSSRATIRIVTVAYYPGDELERFLESIPHATTADVTVVIADNGSDGHQLADLADRYGARIVGDGMNRGYGAGANMAAHDLDEQWIIVANPDVVWMPGSIDQLIAAAECEPRAGCLGPRIVNPDGTMYPSGRAVPTLRTGVGHALLKRIWPANPFSRAYHAEDQIALEEIREVGWLSGACVLLPRELWEQLGGFDENYFMFFEDVDLGVRVSKAGWRNLQVPQACVVHEQGASWKARPEKMIRAHHDSARYFVSDRYSAWWQAPLRWGLSCGLRAHEEWEVRAARRPR